MTHINLVNQKIASLESEITEYMRLRRWLESHSDLFNQLPESGSLPYQDKGIDFDYLPHEEVVRVIGLVGGTWKKEVSSVDNKIDYRTEFDGVKLRCWAGDPPPSCKLVEVEEIVPAQPATTRKVLKLICKEAEPVIPSASVDQPQDDSFDSNSELMEPA